MNNPETGNENTNVQELKNETLIWIDNRNDEKFTETSKMTVSDWRKDAHVFGE